MLKKKLQKVFISLFSFLLCFSLASCDGDQTSTSVPSSVGGINYYNENNFIVSEQKVTETKLVTYEGPNYLKSSSTVQAKVEGVELFVYETRVNHERQFSWTTPSDVVPVVLFDFAGKVHMEVEVSEDVSSALVAPQVYGITPSINSKTISFDLSYPGNYVLEYNNDSNKALHIFANPIEENPITEEMASKDDSIIYIGPGVYKADAIPVESNKTIYFAGGSFVYGQIRGEDLENVTIRGRGILSGAIYHRRSESEYTIPIEIRTSNNIRIEDIAILDSAGWTIALYRSTNVTLENVKIITARQNGDGISVQSCSDVKVHGGFVRTWDDSLVVKNVDGYSTSNITFDEVVVWTDLAQSMEVGYEAHGEKMEDITFQNIIVVHNFHKAVISMHNADDAQISRVTYKNIIVEDAQTLGDNRNDGENDFLIDICVLYNVDWSQSTNIKGTIKDVTIENVKVYQMADTVVSRINGYSATSNISNVHIKDLEIRGKQIKKLDELNVLMNDYSSNVDYANNKTAIGASITLPYRLDLAGTAATKTSKDNIEQEGMLVPEFARSKGDLPYIGVASNISSTVKATHSAGSKTTTPDDDGSGDFSKSPTIPAAVTDKQLDTIWQNAEWKNEDDEFAALTIDFKGELLNVGVVRILGNRENDFYYTYSFQVWGKKLKTDGTINDKYTRLVGLKDYEMSPGSGNCIDVNITTQKYAGIQLRLYRGDLVSSPNSYEISEVQFFEPSLSYNKAIVDSTPHNDVYNVEKVVDGDATGTSYYESNALPAHIVIDLGDVYSVSTIVLALPPSLMWNTRTQEIEIQASNSNASYSASTTSFTTIAAKKGYVFDPQLGNRNIIQLEEPIEARYIKVIISSNDISGGYAAQLSEISVYGN